jgi:hypothetical protein
MFLLIPYINVRAQLLHIVYTQTPRYQITQIFPRVLSCVSLPPDVMRSEIRKSQQLIEEGILDCRIVSICIHNLILFDIWFVLGILRG